MNPPKGVSSSALHMEGDYSCFPLLYSSLSHANQCVHLLPKENLHTNSNICKLPALFFFLKGGRRESIDLLTFG
jgi:hypothetical protein